MGTIIHVIKANRIFMSKKVQRLLPKLSSVVNKNSKKLKIDKDSRAVKSLEYAIQDSPAETKRNSNFFNLTL